MFKLAPVFDPKITAETDYWWRRLQGQFDHLLTEKLLTDSELGKLSADYEVHKQGDQMGRILSYWAIVFFGQFLILHMYMVHIFFLWELFEGYVL
jgi:hypothetical protein